MSKYCKLIQYDEIVNMELVGTTAEDFRLGLEEAFDEKDRMGGKAGECILQTFVASNHLTELEFFLYNGFFIANTMLTFELDLEALPPITPIEPKLPVEISAYDTAKDGLEEYLHANGLGFGKKDPEAMIREQLAMPDSRIYVSRYKGKIVSSVTVWQSSDPDTYCTENIFTLRRYREKHIAANLLGTILAELKDKGAKKARLTVYGDNREAMNMYFDMGFELVGSRYELHFY